MTTEIISSVSNPQIHPSFLELSKTLNLHPLVMKIMQNRKLPLEEIKKFFQGSLAQLPPFHELKDIAKAAKLLASAIEENKTIGVYGDYDVDGTTSCALLVHFFRMCGAKEIKSIQPSRFKEGYGLHESSIDDALAQGIEILITVDCGITAVVPAAYAKSKNLTLIITDHHQDIAEQMPDAFAIVNPNRRDDGHKDFYALAGVGVAFALSVCIKDELKARGKEVPGLDPLLPFVAIGSLADIAHLNFVNRMLVGHGLKALEKSTIPGLKMLYDQYAPAQKECIKSEMVGFGIGPLINSKGRMDHPENALTLLTSDDPLKCSLMFQDLQMMNQQRKDTQKRIAEEAITMVGREINCGEHTHVVIAYQRDWHEGVIGIVASKLVEHFSRPAIVLARDAHLQGYVKGSARAPKGFALLPFLDSVKHLLYKFGGHSAAAGMTLMEDNIIPLKEELNQSIAKTYPQGVPAIPIEVDLELTIDDVTYDFFQHLGRLEPYGNGNPQPIFRLKNIVLDDFTILRGGHLQWVISNGVTGFAKRALKGISFYYLNKLNKTPPQEILNRQKVLKDQNIRLSVVARIQENVYKEKRSLQLEVIDFEFPDSLKLH